jgi:hypothetical protein
VRARAGTGRFAARLLLQALLIRFKDFVADLEGTMLSLCRDCFGDEALPAHVPTEHTPRERRRLRGRLTRP